MRDSRFCCSSEQPASVNNSASAAPVFISVLNMQFLFAKNQG